MFSLKCEKCDNNGMIVINEKLTLDEYMKGANYLVDELGELQEASIQQHLIYQCIKCEELYKFTYRDWEKLMRMQIAKDVMSIRKQKMFRTELNPYDIDPDNGLEYCGQCDGFDNEGNCLVDIIKRCTIRKK